MENGFVKLENTNKISTISFFHPKSNSLPSDILAQLAAVVKEASENSDTNIILIKSEGEKAFCAGASFDELLEIDSFDKGKNFFLGFARVINEIRKSPKLTICRVQGKVVGGGVGLVAACDYAYAIDESSIKLSEYALGIGPFVVGPAVERKIGKAAFSQMSIDYDWRDATWARNRGLYSDTFETIQEMDEAIAELTKKLAENSFEAGSHLKQIFWEGTENWDELLEQRAEISGKLVMSDFTRNYIKQFKEKKS